MLSWILISSDRKARSIKLSHSRETLHRASKERGFSAACCGSVICARAEVGRSHGTGATLRYPDAFIVRLVPTR